MHKSPLLIVSIVKGAVSSLREFLATESTWKIMKKCFLFHHNKLNLSLVNQILLILCILIKPNIWNSWSLKILAIKRWFPLNFAKIYRTAILWWMNQKASYFLQTLLLRAAFKILYCRVTVILVCLLLTILTYGRTCALLNSVQKFIEIQGWLHLTFFICLHNQLSSFISIIVQMSEKCNSSNRQ